MSTPNPTLRGRGIVITRPAEQSAGLAKLIEREGGRAIVFPAIAFEDVADRSHLDAVIQRLDDFDIAIFISPNAAAKAMAAIRAKRAWPSRLVAAAIGAASARELKSHGIERVLVPARRFDTEGLLELPEFHRVAAKRVVIFRGEGGRPVLGDSLALRGARVTYAECYRRVKPRADVSPLVEAWSRGEIDAVVATSSEGLRNFHEMLDDEGRSAAARTPLFVPHPRIAEAARSLGVEVAIITASGDESIVAGIASHFTAGRS